MVQSESSTPADSGITHQIPLRIGILCYGLDVDVVSFAQRIQVLPWLSVKLYPISRTGNAIELADSLQISSTSRDVVPVGIRAKNGRNNVEAMALGVPLGSCIRCARESDLVLLFGLLGASAILTATVARILHRRVCCVVVAMPVEFERLRPLVVRLGKTLLLRLVDLILYRTLVTADNLRTMYGVKESRLLCLGAYSSLFHFRALIERAVAGRIELRRKYGLEEGELVYLSVGTLLPFKGFDTLLQAFADVRLKEPHARLLVVGADGAPPLGCLEDLGRIAAELGLGESAAFVGGRSLSEVAELYACSDVFVLPTRWDKAPKVLFEAALAGLPLITTPEAGVDGQLLKSGVNGYLIRSGDSAGLAEAMLACSDPVLRENMGRSSRQLCGQLMNTTNERVVIGTVAQRLGVPVRHL